MTDYNDTGLVIVAAGSSRRFGDGQNKLLMELDGLPVLAHSLRVFGCRFPPGHLVLVISAALRPAAQRILDAEELIDYATLVEGGRERQDSVIRGLMALPEACTIAAIHDAARPRAGLELLEACVVSARLHGSGVAAIRMRDTVKVVDQQGIVQETLARHQLCATETPQVFNRNLILDAYRQVVDRKWVVTDDAQALELAGQTVRLVIHEGDNRKITFRSDL